MIKVAKNPGIESIVSLKVFPKDVCLDRARAVYGSNLDEDSLLDYLPDYIFGQCYTNEELRYINTGTHIGIYAHDYTWKVDELFIESYKTAVSDITPNFKDLAICVIDTANKIFDTYSKSHTDDYRQEFIDDVVKSVMNNSYVIDRDRIEQINAELYENIYDWCKNTADMQLRLLCVSNNINENSFLLED